MSASNWAICPRCLDAAKKESRERFDAASEAYGQVPPEEYERLREEAQPVDPEVFQTFREDYEIYGAKDGAVKVSYSGHCGTCGLGLGFEYEKPFYERDPAA